MVIDAVRSKSVGAIYTRLERGKMPRKIGYWSATGLVGIVTLLAAFSYLTTAPEAVENFRHVGYPQQLRVLLGIAKLAGAIVLLLPRLPILKEWAYAGFTFMWIAAVVAHYLAGDGALSLLPVALLGSLAVSYVTRSANRRASPQHFESGQAESRAA
jgi:DoxX-like family